MLSFTNEFVRLRWTEPSNNNNDNNIDDGMQLLPELLPHIYDFVLPEEIINIALTSKHANAVVNDNALWKHKFQRHFPHVFAQLKQQKTDFLSLNWHSLFIDTYRDEYLLKNNPQAYLYLETDEEPDDITLLPLRERILFSVIKEADVETLKKMQLTIDDLFIVDRHGKSLLNWAVESGSQAVLDYIYQVVSQHYCDADDLVNTQKKINDCSILYWAIKTNQNFVTVLDLVAKGSDLTEKNLGDFTALHLAAIHDRLDLVTHILSLHPNIIDEQDQCGQTALLWAASLGHLSIVDYLCNQGADVNNSTSNPTEKNHGKTSLHWACERGYVVIVGILLKMGSSIHAKTESGQLPIHAACSNGHLNIVKTMIPKYAYLLGKEDNLGQTPLLLAAKGGHLDVVSFLVTKHANLERADNFGQTALLWAAANGHFHVVKYLLKKGAKTDVFTQEEDGATHGKTPLFWAAENGHTTIVDLLIKAGADFNLQIDGSTPLLSAAKEGHKDTVALLFAADPSKLNLQDAEGNTLLHYAVMHGWVDIAMDLLKRGASFKITNNENQTPHMLAKNNKPMLYKLNLLHQIDFLRQQIKTSSHGLFSHQKVLLDQFNAAMMMKAVHIEGSAIPLNLIEFQDTIDKDPDLNRLGRKLHKYK